jgi:Carboxypeptidase regulatory-like domain
LQTLTSPISERPCRLAVKSDSRPKRRQFSDNSDGKHPRAVRPWRVRRLLSANLSIIRLWHCPCLCFVRTRSMPDTFSGSRYRSISRACTKSTLLGYIGAFSVHLAIAVASVFAFSVVAVGQVTLKSDFNPATLMGTVMDINGDTVPNATVSLVGQNGADRSTLETAENGFFQFSHLRPEIPYRIKIRGGICRMDVFHHQSPAGPIQNRGRHQTADSNATDGDPSQL